MICPLSSHECVCDVYCVNICPSPGQNPVSSALDATTSRAPAVGTVETPFGPSRPATEAVAPLVEACPTGFTINGEAVTLESGMNRESEDGKVDYLLVRDGPMFRRWAELLTRAIPSRGRRNWMLAEPDDLERFKRGAARHFEQWLAGERDEDHAAALFFNVNGAEHLETLAREV